MFLVLDVDLLDGRDEHEVVFVFLVLDVNLLDGVLRDRWAARGRDRVHRGEALTPARDSSRRFAIGWTLHRRASPWRRGTAADLFLSAGPGGVMGGGGAARSSGAFDIRRLLQ